MHAKKVEGVVPVVKTHELAVSSNWAAIQKKMKEITRNKPKKPEAPRRQTQRKTEKEQKNDERNSRKSGNAKRRRVDEEGESGKSKMQRIQEGRVEMEDLARRAEKSDCCNAPAISNSSNDAAKKVEEEDLSVEEGIYHERNQSLKILDMVIDGVAGSDGEDDALDEDLIKDEKQEGKDAMPNKKQGNDLPPVDPTDKRAGKYVAIDCEMVGVGSNGERSVLARVSVVNIHGNVLLDAFVKPLERVTDYRTHVSGITPQLLANARDFKEVQTEVAELLKDRVLIGHAVHNDLHALMLTHPARMIRDTATYKPFRAYSKGMSPGLRRLASVELGLDIQSGEHSSVEDAKVTMLLYRKVRRDWEKALLASRGALGKVAAENATFPITRGEKQLYVRNKIKERRRAKAIARSKTKK
ncbi:ribonuclease H-like domain-containing protein [Cladochytrium replicatum]|nr:ribonuclease H-like domain-containing protein [Cladochytrium replicatum]